MEYKQILNIAVLAGEIMLRSGAETYRVEDTMKHILNTARTEVAEAFVMMTGIVATLDNPDMEMLTAMRRVHDRGTNMHRIVQVNEISRRYCRGEMTVEETYEELKQIKGKLYTFCMIDLKRFHCIIIDLPAERCSKFSTDKRPCTIISGFGK